MDSPKSNLNLEPPSLLEAPCNSNAKTVSTLSCVWNLSNLIMGVGMLTLAITVAEAGLVLSMVLIAGYGCLTIFSVGLVVDVTVATKALSYEDLVRKSVGPWAERYTQLCMLAGITTGTAGFLVSIKGLGSFALTTFLGMPDDTLHSDLLLLGLVAVVLVPMSLLRSLDAMQYTSAFSIFCLLWFVGVSVTLTPGLLRDNLPCAKMPDVAIDRIAVWWPESGNSFLSALSIVMGSWICQYPVVPMFNEMREGDAALGLPIQSTKRRFNHAILATVIMCVVTYVVTALSGYFSWFSAVSVVDLVLQCYEPHAWYIVLTYFGLVLVCLFSYPLFLFVARLIVLRLLGKPDATTVPFRMFALIGLACIGVSLVPALLFKNLGRLTSVGCGLAGPALTLEIPAMCGLYLEGNLHRAKCWALLVVGTLVHILVIVFLFIN